jgi:RNA recognition motif-containing protein
MTKTKSAAQIRRLKERATKRGEKYIPPPPPKEEEPELKTEETTTTATETASRLTSEVKEIEDNAELKSKDRRTAKRKAEAIAASESGMPAEEFLKWYETQKQTQSKVAQNKEEDPLVEKKKQAAIKLQKSVKKMEDNAELKAKDRRSAKRKAEAIATEESGVPAEELLKWFDSQPKRKSGKSDKKQRNHDPYIAFIGQLSFDTTRDQLVEHMLSQLKTDFPKIKSHELRIRMLTDQKTKKSRGMAFCEVDDPELLYALLKLHQTFLNGRRINVERSAGGKKNSDKRKSKIQQYRKEQDTYFAEVVDSILSEYKKTGELRDDELDEGVIALCKRHAGPVVRAAVAKYVEGSGRDMDNPSAYLTFLVTKFAEEGIYEDRGDDQKHNQKPKRKSSSAQKSSSERSSSKRLKTSSKFAQSGVDMSQSEGTSDINKIFPSARRGRGYMM